MRRKKNAQVDATLSDLQYQVMRVLWDRGEAAASDVQQRLAEDGKKLALTTVSTLLSRLASRHLVRSRREGRQVFHSANVSERDVKRGMVSNLMGTLFAGDPKALVTHLVRESDLEPGDLETLRRLLEEKDAK